jgi:hypothetical protein
MQLTARLQPLADSLPKLRRELGQQPGAQQPQQHPLQQHLQAQPQQGVEPDPFGVRAALGAGRPLALAAWREYLRAVAGASAAAERLLSGPDLDQLSRFGRERRELVGAL